MSSPNYNYNRYSTEAVVKAASLVDMTHDVFAPGPDGRVAIRMIKEGDYLGGPVADDAELNALAAPITGEFHFNQARGTYSVWDGTQWKHIGGTEIKIIEGDAIDIWKDGVDVTEANDGDVTVKVKYDTAQALDLTGGKLAVQTDDTTVFKDSNGKLEVRLDTHRHFHPVTTAYDTYGRPTQYTYDIEGTTITVPIAYTNNGLTATITDSVADGNTATTKTYNYTLATRSGTIT